MHELWSDFKHFLRIFAKVWVVTTAVIGSFFVFGLIALFLAIGALMGDSSSMPQGEVVREGGSEEVALLNLNGVIMDDATPDPFSGSTGIISARRTSELLDELAENDDVKAIVIRINSPGGAVVASDELAQKIKAVNAKKPIVFSFADVSASGGYYIAANASKIVANPATITGSIGVIAEFPEVSGLLELVGVELRTIKSGSLKDMGSPTRQFTEQERQVFQTMIDEAYGQFTQVVADGRKMDIAKVKQIADGRIYTGKQAKELGLVDELGSTDTAIDLAAQLAQIEDPSVIEYSNKSFVETLFESSLNRVSPMASLMNLTRLTQQPGVYYLMQ
jgi:protease IV